MNPQERNPAFLWDILESARLITEFLTSVSYSDFVASRLLQSAVERQLEIIGEASRKITPEFQQNHPEIPWRSMIGLRNILIHEYGEIRAERIWWIAKNNIPELVILLIPLIPSPPGE